MSQTLAAPYKAAGTAPVLGAISFCHLLNDMMQALLPAIYPILKGGFALSFGQIGLLTLTYQTTASVLQPVVGMVTDRRPMPYSLATGMSFTLIGLLTLALASDFGQLLAGAALLGIGSSVFHPESSRIARLASGGRHGLAQSVFQVGGNFGQALGPLLAAFFVLPRGQTSLAWFTLVALGGILILGALGRWYKKNGHARRGRREIPGQHALTRRQVGLAILVLLGLIFSKYFYLASITSYYIFYLMHRFGISVHAAQIDLFIFLAATALGTMAGGPIGDRLGRRWVISASIIGVLPFTLALPYVGLQATVLLSIVIGLILSSAFSAILVYAQELMPGRVGMVSGLFFGFAFGMGGIGAAVLGMIADRTGIDTVYRICSFLPALGLLTVLLPRVEGARVQTITKG